MKLWQPVLRPYNPDRTPPARDALPVEHASFIRDEMARAIRAPQIVDWLARHLPQR